MYEASERLRFEAYLDTSEDESRERILSLTIDLRDSFNEGKFHEYVASELFHKLFLDYETFVSESSRNSKTFAYWILLYEYRDLFIDISSRTMKFHSVKNLRSRPLIGRTIFSH